MNVQAYAHLTIGILFIAMGCIGFILFVYRNLVFVQNGMLDRETAHTIAKFARRDTSDIYTIEVEGSTYTLDGWRKEFTNRSESIVNELHAGNVQTASTMLYNLRSLLNTLPFYSAKNTEYRVLDDIESLINAL